MSVISKREDMKRYRLKNHDRLIEKQRLWREENREEYNSYFRDWRERSGRTFKKL